MATAAESGPDARERILEAALEDFSQNGFDGARTREIASRAGVPLGLLQYHFGAKSKLWQAAVDRAFARMKAGLAEILEDPAPASEAERLRLLVRAHTRFVAENPTFVRIMHDEGKRPGPRMRWLVDRHVKPLFEPMIALIERAQAEGFFPRDIPAVHFAYVMVGAVGVFFHQAEECKRVSGIDPSDPDAIANHQRAVEYLMFGQAQEEDSP